jgi:hypothetical protein
VDDEVLVAVKPAGLAAAVDNEAFDAVNPAGLAAAVDNEAVAAVRPGLGAAVDNEAFDAVRSAGLGAAVDDEVVVAVKSASSSRWISRCTSSSNFFFLARFSLRFLLLDLLPSRLFLHPSLNEPLPP